MDTNDGHVHIKNEQLLSQLRDEVPCEEDFYNLSETFKIFGDSTRIKLLWALMKNEMCVCELSDLLEMTHSAVSHQLRVLRQARLVKKARRGKEAYYSLDDEHVAGIISAGWQHVNE